MTKILILGKSRSGKDSCAEIWNREFGLSYISSSEFACDHFIFDKLKDKYGYTKPKECHEDRNNHGAERNELICEYNKHDKSKLCRKILEYNDAYVGMRCREELLASRSLFDVIVRVDASERIGKSIDSGYATVTADDAHFIIKNNKSLEEFERIVISIGRLLFK